MNRESAMAIKPFFIRAEWDEEAQVWVASSDDVPGLATEEKTLEGLITRQSKVLSFLRRQESIACRFFWIPAFAGMTSRKNMV